MKDKAYANKCILMQLRNLEMDYILTPRETSAVRSARDLISELFEYHRYDDPELPIMKSFAKAGLRNE